METKLIEGCKIDLEPAKLASGKVVPLIVLSFTVRPSDQPAAPLETLHDLALELPTAKEVLRALHQAVAIADAQQVGPVQPLQ